ncbi:MAG: hypothetical protein JNL52_11535 [Flavobacteriales bacterium]|nr:hypothetical protein [Flavobacteriales bacterium]
MRPLVLMLLIGAAIPAFAQPSGTPRTLFGDSLDLTGGYFGMTARYTNVLSNDAVLFGFSGAVVIGHKINIGLAGCWSTSVLKNPAYEEVLREREPNIDLSGLELRYGYGGFLIEPIIFHRSAVHLTVPVIVGVGGVSYSYPPPNSNSYQRNRTDGQAFFALEPGLELELSVVSALRIGIGGSFLYTSDLDLPATSTDVLRTAMGRMTLKFGAF